MKLTLHRFTSDVPSEKICRPGVDYQAYASDVTSEEALKFFDKLTRARDGFYLETPGCLLNFWKHEGALWVEVTSAEFWGTSGISLAEARAIIELLDRGGEFTSRIPTTGREWDAYALPGKGAPAEDAAI